MIIKYVVLALLCYISSAYAGSTQFQLLGTIEIINDGTIRVGTTENSNVWSVSGCDDQVQMVISNSITVRDQWLSLLMLAKTSGIKVRFIFANCNNNVPGNYVELNLQ